MKSDFNLLISFRTPEGFKVCGQYFLGNDPDFAAELFGALVGRKGDTDKALLHLDLLEHTAGIPVRINTMGCKLSELSTNIERVTRQLFRLYAIETHQVSASLD